MTWFNNLVFNTKEEAAIMDGSIICPEFGVILPEECGNKSTPKCSSCFIRKAASYSDFEGALTEEE